MSDAADELVALILERLDVLDEINRSTFNSAHPTNCGLVQRWIEDLRYKVTYFNLKTITHLDNPFIPGNANVAIARITADAESE